MSAEKVINIPSVFRDDLPPYQGESIVQGNFLEIVNLLRLRLDSINSIRVHISQNNMHEDDQKNIMDLFADLMHCERALMDNFFKKNE